MRCYASADMHHYTPVAEADLPEVFRIMRLAFTGEEEGQRQWLATMGLENLRAMRADEGGAPEAVLSLVRLGQHFGGRVVPMSGVVGVGVPPERRGGGLAQQMMSACLREARETGAPISTLYASTQALYRKVGYEQAGSRFLTTIRLDQIGVRERAGSVRQITDADADAVMACAARFASRFDGPLDRGAVGGWSAYCWHRIRDLRTVKFQGFAISDNESADAIDAYAYIHQARIPESGRQRLVVSDLAFTTPGSGRRLLSLLADFATMGDEVSFHGSPTHPILALMPMQRFRVERHEYWMTRIADLPKALEARGYLPGVRASINLEVTDPIIPENTGAWTLEIEGGRASVARGGKSSRPTIRADIRGLAPLYTGFVTPAQARMLGWIEADDDDVRAASPIFPGGCPWMVDMF